VEDALTAGGASVAIAALALIAICWRSRTVLGGAVGVVAIAFVVVAFTARRAGVGREAWLLVAVIALLMGVVLYVLGRLIGRLLDGDPEAGS
jgi:hypothetical protein